MPGRFGNFIGQFTTQEILGLSVEYRRPLNIVYDSDTKALLTYATYGESYPSISLNGAGQFSYSTYNTVKGRIEFYAVDTVTGEQFIIDAKPARVWKDNFMAAETFVPAILGLESELPWDVNGRANGAVDPNTPNFLAANDIGGGLIMRVLGGGQVGDYTAIHWGGNYPVIVSKSPHLQIIVDNWDGDIGSKICIGGFVGDTRSEDTDPFALPDDGIYGIVFPSYFGDNNMRVVVRVAGVDEFVFDTGGPPPAGKLKGNIIVNDDGDEVSFYANGMLLATHSGALPAVQLQPYFMVGDDGGPSPTDLDVGVFDLKIIEDVGY